MQLRITEQPSDVWAESWVLDTTNQIGLCTHCSVRLSYGRVGIRVRVDGQHYFLGDYQQCVECEQKSALLRHYPKVANAEKDILIVQAKLEDIQNHHVLLVQPYRVRRTNPYPVQMFW